MKADDTRTTTDDAAERFAAAVDGTPGAVDAQLARELEIAHRLSERSAALDPEPEARARAKRRLMAALAEEPPVVADDGPSRAS